MKKLVTLIKANGDNQVQKFMEEYDFTRHDAGRWCQKWCGQMDKPVDSWQAPIAAVIIKKKKKKSPNTYHEQQFLNATH